MMLLSGRPILRCCLYRSPRPTAEQQDARAAWAELSAESEDAYEAGLAARSAYVEALAEGRLAEAAFAVFGAARDAAWGRSLAAWAAAEAACEAAQATAEQQEPVA